MGGTATPSLALWTARASKTTLDSQDALLIPMILDSEARGVHLLSAPPRPKMGVERIRCAFQHTIVVTTRPVTPPPRGWRTLCCITSSEVGFQNQDPEQRLTPILKAHAPASRTLSLAGRQTRGACLGTGTIARFDAEGANLKP
jgi:hypothetical protein